jgi:hypothetical protein
MNVDAMEDYSVQIRRRIRFDERLASCKNLEFYLSR